MLQNYLPFLQKKFFFIKNLLHSSHNTDHDIVPMLKSLKSCQYDKQEILQKHILSVPMKALRILWEHGI